MADAADRRSGSPGHAQRVSVYVDALVDALGLYGPEASQILVAARLHDVGKSLIPETILHKPGPLSAEEWLVVKKHPVEGADLLMAYTAMAGAALMVRNHHERIDGLGYPFGLSGPMIPIGARIISVADSFDAMVTARPYTASITPAHAAHYLVEGAGSQWDATVVKVFLERVLPQLLPELLPALAAPVELTARAQAGHVA
jgi:HD-GYP domain-containing protein (c-di-GMP phosphodiesterase class II)